jgi:hypothetical protein
MQIVLGTGRGVLVSPQRDGSAMSLEGESTMQISTLILLIVIGGIGGGFGYFWSRAGRRQGIAKQ